MFNSTYEHLDLFTVVWRPQSGLCCICEHKWLQSGVKLKCFLGAKFCQTFHIYHYGLGLDRNYVKSCWQNLVLQDPNSISGKILPYVLDNCLSLGNQCFWLSLFIGVHPVPLIAVLKSWNFPLENLLYIQLKWYWHLLL